jgi:hypothetical protein
MNLKLGRRFLFAVIADICASIVTVILKYPPEIYYKILIILAGIFTVGQTITDYKNGGEVK